MHPKGKLVHASVVCFSFATGCQARMPLLYGRMQIPSSIPARMVHKIWPSLASQVEVIHAQCWAPLAATQNNSSPNQPINNSLHPGSVHLQTKQMRMYACVPVAIGLNLVTMLDASLNRTNHPLSAQAATASCSHALEKRQPSSQSE